MCSWPVRNPLEEVLDLLANVQCLKVQHLGWTLLQVWWKYMSLLENVPTQDWLEIRYCEAEVVVEGKVVEHSVVED